MNVNKVFHKLWNNGSAKHVAQVSANESPSDTRVVSQHNFSGNVVPLPYDFSCATPDDSSSASRLDKETPSTQKRIRGLMNASELESFFNDNHFGLGRHNGANYRSHEALELGKRSLIARFHNVLGDLIARRQEKLHKMQMEMIAIEGVSQTMSAQLRLACEQTQSEVALLEKQIEHSDVGQGWVLDALNRYQIGFNKGLREAIDFELLSR